MNDHSATANVLPGSVATTTADRKTRWAALFVIVLGPFIVFGATYANPGLLHDAAHDSRHAMGFPCH